MAAARPSPRRAAMVEVEEEVHELQEGDFTVEVVQAGEDEGVVSAGIAVSSGCT